MAEADLIKANNIFGDDILNINTTSELVSDEFYDEEEVCNPFSKFLSDFVSETTSLAAFEGIKRDSFRTPYELAISLALDYVGGDETVAHAIVRGVVGFHEIPTDIRGSSERLQWLKKTIEVRKAESDAWFAEMGISLELGDDSTSEHPEEMGHD